MEVFDKKEMTIGEKYGPAMKITSRKEAKEYLEECIQHTMRFFNKTRKEARDIELANLGYYAGYCDTDTRKRVEYLFNCVHPVFGPAKSKIITAEEALELGMKMAKGDLELINQPKEQTEPNRFNSLEI